MARADEFPPYPVTRSERLRHEIDAYTRAVMIEAKQDTECLWIVKCARAKIEAHRNALEYAEATKAFAKRTRSKALARIADEQIQRLAVEIDDLASAAGIVDPELIRPKRR